MQKLDTKLSPFETQQQADDYLQWLTEKVERADKEDVWLSHEEVVAQAARRRAELLGRKSES